MTLPSEKKPRILVTGSFNMDLIGTGGRIPGMGETLIGESFRTAPGGKGSNQAIQCARLGARVVMAGCVGKDAFGEELLNAHREAGVDIRHVRIAENVPTGVALIEVERSEAGSQNRILVIPGANAAMVPEDLAWLEDEIGGFDMLLLQLEIPAEVNAYAAKLAHAKGVPVMLNPAPAAGLSPELLSCLTYLSPNESEITGILGEKPLTREELTEERLEPLAKKLMARGAEKILVTLGDKGSMLFGPDGVKRQGIVSPEKVLDPTAAGDSYVAAFCTGLSGGMTEEEAMSFAAAAAALTVSGEGALPSLPFLREVEKLSGIQAPGCR